VLLYLDQNYLSGIAKRKPAFRELELLRVAELIRRARASTPGAAASCSPGADPTWTGFAGGSRGFCASGATPEANSPTSDNGAYDNRIGSTRPIGPR
jgi:hypothetical protein